MKKNFLHIVGIPMTGLGLHQGFRGQEWYAHRINLFKNYTLKSLLNQTNRDFITWIAVRPQEKDNPLTIELIDYLKKIPNFPFIFTYGGCFLWDDKYKNDNLLERLKIILPQLKELLTNEKYIYETCHSSDDLSHRKDLEEVSKHNYKERRILVHDKGFIFHKDSQRLAEWNPIINPPFYTIMFPADVFFDPIKHYKYMRNSKSHEDVVRLFDPVYLPDNRYIVLVHNKNISTNWWHAYRGRIFSREETDEILKDFGIKAEKTFIYTSGIGETMAIMKHFAGKILIKIGFYKYAKFIKNTIEEYFHQQNRQ